MRKDDLAHQPKRFGVRVYLIELELKVSCERHWMKDPGNEVDISSVLSRIRFPQMSTRHPSPATREKDLPFQEQALTTYSDHCPITLKLA